MFFCIVVNRWPELVHEMCKIVASLQRNTIASFMVFSASLLSATPGIVHEIKIVSFTSIIPARLDWRRDLLNNLLICKERISVMTTSDSELADAKGKDSDHHQVYVRIVWAGNIKDDILRPKTYPLQYPTKPAPSYLPKS